MQLRQDRIAERAAGAEDEHRFEGWQCLLVPLHTRHVPHPSDIAMAIDDQHAFRAKTDARISEGRGQDGSAR
jgi:hypothetical protein